jgi:hypothetical protein
MRFDLGGGSYLFCFILDPKHAFMLSIPTIKPLSPFLFLLLYLFVYTSAVNPICDYPRLMPINRPY